ncbi:DUF3150 domain-containing protein [Thiohalocapsa marina]|uniref:DUF3150 domain-containing protein n=1 Tax=Thiohalocapsa marina TaxID=424902 RepID=UPI0036DAF4F7
MTTDTTDALSAADTTDAMRLEQPTQTLRLTNAMTLFLIDYHIWSGRKKLRPEDLRMGGNLPPDGLVSLGSKKVCDPDALRVFHRKRRHVERQLLAVGTRFLSGYLVPNTHAADVLAQITAITAEAREAAEDFLADYDRHIDAWCAAYPTWEQAIRNAIDPVEVVRGQLRFRVLALQIETAEGVAEDTLADDLAAVGETIFSEVEQVARSLEQSFLGRDALSQRAVGTFRRIYDKLDALSFADYRIDPVVRALHDWLGRLPASGPIGGSLFLEGWALMRLVGDAQAMARHGAGILALSELMPDADAIASLAGTDHRAAEAEDADEVDAEATAVADPADAPRPDAETALPMDTPAAEPVTDFDDLFDEMAATAPAPTTPPSGPPEPIGVQDFWF